MTDIRRLKKQARLRAAANGTSHQAELNAIARGMGHVSWGALMASLATIDPAEVMRRSYPAPRVAPPHMLASMTTEERAYDAELERQRYDMLPIEDPEGELRDLIDAYQAARRTGGHLVVLRPTHAREEKVIELLWMYRSEGPADERLDGIAFTPFLDDGGVAIEHANSHGDTLVAGSRGMRRSTNSGQFVVHDAQEQLSQINALYSRRDQEIIYATTSVKYLLPRNDDATVELIRRTVGPTTVRRRTPAKSRRPSDEGSRS